MPWNYRVFHTAWQLPGEVSAEESFTIREAYYADPTDETPHAISAARGGSAPAGATLTELMKDLACMQAAFRRPILTPSDIPGYVYDTHECSPETTPDRAPTRPTP